MIAMTKKWIDKVAIELKKDTEFQQKAKGLDSNFQFILDPMPDKDITEKKACGLQIPFCDKTWEGISTENDILIQSSYETFYKVLNNKLMPIAAILSRKIKVKGNPLKLLRYNKAINRFMAVLGTIETEFEGKFK